MKNDLVVKDNVLINASYNLDVAEQRLILLSIVRARETGQGITAESKLEVHASDYMDHFKVDKSAAYEALKGAVDNLFNRYFSYKEQRNDGTEFVVKSRWVSRVAYASNAAILELTFAPDVVPLITRLEQQFTSYQIKQVGQLTSKYAIRLYELLIMWRSVGKCLFSIDDFRFKLGIADNEYQSMSNFKSRVLEPAIKQINQFTDIRVKYEQHKQGRTITGFTFKFRVISEVNKLAKVTNQPSIGEIFTKITDPQRHLFANKLSRLPEMNTYSQGTESFEQFAVRIAEMLKDAQKFEELFPYLQKVGFATA